MAEHGHGHESHESHESSGNEWLGPKLKQFLKASGLTAGLSMVLFATFFPCMPIVPAYIAAQGLLGGGVSMWGASAAKKPEKKSEHGAGHGGGGHH